MTDENPRQPAGSTTLTRSQVADRLGVSVATVRRREGKSLHPTIGENGWRYFDEDEVNALADGRKRPKKAPKGKGQIAAAAFRMFQEHKELADIVIALEQPPEVVRALYSEWSVGLADGDRRRKRHEARAAVDTEERRQAAEHEKRMKEMDADFQRQQKQEEKLRHLSQSSKR